MWRTKTEEQTGTDGITPTALTHGAGGSSVSPQLLLLLLIFIIIIIIRSRHFTASEVLPDVNHHEALIPLFSTNSGNVEASDRNIHLNKLKEKFRMNQKLENWEGLWHQLPQTFPLLIRDEFIKEQESKCFLQLEDQKQKLYFLCRDLKISS